jgi:ABC-2 type transport system ATP-binding protein
MIKVESLFFEYADKRALNNVSFEISEGAITALVGPNGAGKTTLMRCIAALQKPLSGEIIVNNINVVDHPRETHKNIGYLSDFFGLYDTLTVRQCLQFTAYSRMENAVEAEKAIPRVIEQMGIGSFVEKKVNALSRGMRQRVGIAQAIIHQPKLILLDEPASGLDPEARYALSELLVQLKNQGMTIIVSSHILAELEDYSTEMLVIRDGKIIEHRSLSERYTSWAPMHVLLEHSPFDYAEIFKSINGVMQYQRADNLVQFQLDTTLTGKREILKMLIEKDVPVSEFYEKKTNLQDEYIKTVEHYNS